MARYYRSDLGKNARVSTEITGYAVSTLLFFYLRSGQSEHLESALRAARFLTRTAWDAQLRALPFEYSSNGDQPPALAYFFDTGIIIRGLLAAWRVTHETEFHDTAIAAGRAMLADFGSRDAIHPILALPNKRPLAYESSWSRRPGCYQLKSAMAWFELFEVTGESCFLRAYESALERALASERDFLPGEGDPQKVVDRLHAYAYFLEGLLPVLHRTDAAQAFREGIDRAAVHLREFAPLFVRSDVYAQLLRLRLYGEILGAMPIDRAAAAYEAGEAAAFQICSDDPCGSGGFSFGRKGGQLLPFVNPVSSAFCAQALTLWDDHQNHELKAHRHDLI
ncbi:MAG: hypothetical protein ABI833_06185 [Acidobacteriota bacterium]